MIGGGWDVADDEPACRDRPCPSWALDSQPTRAFCLQKEGDWLIGLGCATACHPAFVVPATARASLTGDGQAMVETAANGVGTGAYTVIAQTAARKLGLDLSRVGDSRLPPGPLAGSPAPGWVSKLAGEGLWRKRHTYGEFVLRRI
jgi:xanthine dehydrogenase YagR molybdenum-binding subunit